MVGGLVLVFLFLSSVFDGCGWGWLFCVWVGSCDVGLGGWCGLG